ncbi:dTDP-4-dehydrorhamnose 3,5-epimerase [Alsobacter soli]|uniref:dTDP-4-dehydrorhamnose 3,5-epimerase n=1 Tax=Alsobacter soli TaxID=2109933 RepID=A0A2T1HQT4_9HYPH|nr:dTDP-4-dehydrorhamnose 3,5-epimerase [Alsobacter soli]PSC03992.1 dTDP-4-dehydrorhamnose 3,5-epimerase [Alsobacter soli]
MRFVSSTVAGAYLIEIDPARDERGFFARTFCADEFTKRGLETDFVQHSTSYNVQRGTLRGMHFQREPHQEAKVVRCLQGAIWDVVLDLRPSSPTYRAWQGFELSSSNRRQLYIPKGCAHGFQTLTADAEVGYLISTRYAPEAAAGVRFDDPAFGILWPLPVAAMSPKDGAWPLFEPARA